MEKRRGNSGFFQDRHWGRLGLVLGRLQQTDAAARLPSTDQNAAGAGKTEGVPKMPISECCACAKRNQLPINKWKQASLQGLLMDKPTIDDHEVLKVYQKYK
ncbi:uncharacterized protein LOC127756383 [Oryza glaberrima]|uniref:uncharacterized protein LOC127756383 n=1 Tax=Oryza glaberrima TaxID=4538 RepID=UPI00224C16F8|nr:uncharacterized protein LOC127756383 [Oryza glaberrima]